MKKIILIIVAILLSCNPVDPDKKDNNQNKRYTTPILKEKHNKYIVYDLNIVVETEGAKAYYQYIISDSSKIYERNDSLVGNYSQYYNPKENYIIAKIYQQGGFERLILYIFKDDSLIAKDSVTEHNNYIKLIGRW